MLFICSRTNLSRVTYQRLAKVRFSLDVYLMFTEVLDHCGVGLIEAGVAVPPFGLGTRIASIGVAKVGNKSKGKPVIFTVCNEVHCLDGIAYVFRFPCRSQGWRRYAHARHGTGVGRNAQNVQKIPCGASASDTNWLVGSMASAFTLDDTESSTARGGSIWGPLVPPESTLLVEVALVSIRPRQPSASKAPEEVAEV